MGQSQSKFQPVLSEEECQRRARKAFQDRVTKDRANGVPLSAEILARLAKEIPTAPQQQYQYAPPGKRPRQVETPCIADKSWHSDKSWRRFKRTFLDDPKPIYLRLNDGRECPTCHQSFSDDVHDAKPIRLPCNGQHVICRECALQWFRKIVDENLAGRNQCPSCRQPLFKQKLPQRTY